MEIRMFDIYAAEKHAVLHRWSYLQNPNKNFEKIAGYFKFSVNVVEAGEPRLTLTDEPAKGLAKGSAVNLLYPPEIKLKKYQVTLRLGKGKDFMAMDEETILTKGKCDPYAILKYNGMEVNSSVRESTLAPSWNEELLLPVMIPTVAENVILTFKDHETIGNDVMIGSVSFNIHDIIEGKLDHPFWIHIYGGPKDAENEKEQKLMDSEPCLGSFLKGSVLISWKAEEIKGIPLLKKVPAKEALDEGVIAAHSLELRVRVGYMFNCYSTPNEQHLIMVKWGGATLRTSYAKNDHGVILWNQSGDLKQTFHYNDVSELPDVFVYLVMKGKKNGGVVSYKRLSPQVFFNVKTADDYFFMEPEKCNNASLRDDQGGMLKIRLGVQKEEEWKSIEKESDWVMGHQEQPKYSPITIVTNIFQAKKLAAADEDGLSDPMALVYHFGNSQQTAVYPKTLNPNWNQRLLINTYAINGIIPPLIITLYDYDPSTLLEKSKFDFIGGLLYYFKPEDLVTTHDQIPDPKWQDVRYSHDLVVGKLLMSATVLQKHTPTTQVLKTIEVPKEKHFIKVKILGLRDLQSQGVFPVRSAFLKMHTLQSLEEATNGRDVEYGTQPKDTGPNPNICSVLSFEMTLPVEPTLMPLLTWQVFDQALGGFGKSTPLGNFDLDLGISALITKASILRSVKSYLRKNKKAISAARIENLEKVAKVLLSQISEERKKVKLEKGALLKFQSQMGGSNLLDSDIHEEEEGALDHAESQLKSLVNVGSKKMEQEHQEEHNDLKMAAEAHEAFDNGDEEEEEHTQLLGKLQEDLAKEGTVQSGGEDKQKLRNDNPLTIESPFSSARESQNLGDLTIVEEENKEMLEMATVEQHQAGEASSLRTAFNKISSSKRKKFSKFFVLLPEYEEYTTNGVKKRREMESPSAEEYCELGYGDHKHYRYQVGTELEKTKIIGSSKFRTVPIFRGKQVGKTSFLERLFMKKKNAHYHECGRFKGSVEIMSSSTLRLLETIKEEKQLLDNLGVPTTKEDFTLSPLDQQLLRKTEVLVRFYAIDANIFESYDIASESDPYIRVVLGDKEIINDRGSFIENRNSPKFMKMFSINTIIPGPSALRIQLWDYDPLVKDDFIGETVIDIENRFFDQRFRNLEHFPVENREIKHPSSDISKASMRMWLEIYDSKDHEKAEKIKKTYDISPKPETHYQLRVIVYEVHDVPLSDIEGTTDIYVTGHLNGYSNIQQKTDTHYRSQNGFGSFNWRMLWNMKFDHYTNIRQMSLSLKIFDKDLVSRDDYLSEATINMADFFKETMLNRIRNKMFGRDFNGLANKEKFCIETIPNPTLSDSSKKKRSKMIISIEMVPKEEYFKRSFTYRFLFQYLSS